MDIAEYLQPDPQRLGIEKQGLEVQVCPLKKSSLGNGAG